MRYKVGDILVLDKPWVYGNKIGDRYIIESIDTHLYDRDKEIPVSIRISHIRSSEETKPSISKLVFHIDYNIFITQQELRDRKIKDILK